MSLLSDSSNSGRIYKRAGSGILLALVVSVVTSVVTVSAQSIDEYPVVRCTSAVVHCQECRKVQTLTVCFNCDEGYSTVVNAVTVQAFGKCAPYDSTKCNLANCVRCAADDPNKCIECPVGYPNSITYKCADVPPDSSTPSSPHSSTTTSSTTTSSTTTSSTTTPTSDIKDCLVPQCATCVPGQKTICSTCQSATVLMKSGLCKAYGTCSVADCIQCYPEDDNRCSSCSPGFALSRSNACTLHQSSNAAVLSPMSVLAAPVIAAAAYIL